MMQPPLPPWGAMNEGLLDEIRHQPKSAHWKPSDNSKASVGKWNTWRDSVIEEIGGLLWPPYAAGTGAWQTPQIRALFDADFALLAQLAPLRESYIQAMYPSTVPHLDLFQEEDDETKLFATGYERYDPTLSARIRKQLQDEIEAGIHNKVGSLDLQMKQKFLRPRPYQVAVIQGRRRFTCLNGKTANTPSMVSGHCLESSIGACAAFDALSSQLPRASLSVFSQFAVDIGDRRVMAGLHYPSDNLSSWYTAFRLLRHVFPPARVGAVRAFLWHAVSKKSCVFKSIQQHVRQVPASPYKRAVTAIRNLALSR